MNWIKTFESFYKFNDFYDRGGTHKVYFIDDEWLYKTYKKDPDDNKFERKLKRIEFDHHIEIMKKYPDIFVEVKRLDRYRLAVKKVNKEAATEEIKYFYGYLHKFFHDNEEFNLKYFDTVTKNGYTEIIFKFTYSFEFYFKPLLVKFKEYAIENNDLVVIKWCEFIEKIIKSNVNLETDYFDSKSWNFGLDKDGNIKMYDF